eukprot:634123-Pelagomonas_calceolata.AAC.1
MVGGVEQSKPAGAWQARPLSSFGEALASLLVGGPPLMHTAGLGALGKRWDSFDHRHLLLLQLSCPYRQDNVSPAADQPDSRA